MFVCGYFLKAELWLLSLSTANGVLMECYAFILVAVDGLAWSQKVRFVERNSDSVAETVSFTGQIWKSVLLWNFT